ncbi:MAG: hypothetical protein HC871_03235 [Rhizobiales bacterium]|nr:hypothetical protein [Hyphomicrobiales bacterium]
MTVGPSATLATVAQRMRFDRIVALVVADGEKLLGMISHGTSCTPSPPIANARPTSKSPRS